MTDLPAIARSVPARMGVSARFEEGQLLLDLVPQDATLHHGIVRASVLSYVIDAAAGIVVDRGADVWTLTSDLSVRMCPVVAPASISSTTRVLRTGRRSSSCLVELTSAAGDTIATGVAGFANIPRRDTDPPKPVVQPSRASEILRATDGLDQPLREAAGIEVIDAAEGIVQVDVTPELRNPAGTLQGAMVALVAEAGAEDLVATRFESPVVVVDLDIRYLAQAPVGPVRTRSRLLGAGPDAPVLVELIDVSTDRLTTVVYARAVPVG
jgi:acyl-coenzyme A thioesterase PaaI-like protein